MEISVIDGKLAIVFCKDLSLDSLELEQLAAGLNANDSFSPIAREDSLVVEDGHPLILGSEELRAQHSAQLSVEPGTVYSVIYSVHNGEVGRYATFVVPQAGLQPGVWVRTDNSTRGQACGR